MHLLKGIPSSLFYMLVVNVCGTDLDGWRAAPKKLRQSGRHIGPVKSSAVVTALLSMKVLWDIPEDDPNNAFSIKENM